jgi:hypothetical protein
MYKVSGPEPLPLMLTKTNCQGLADADDTVGRPGSVATAGEPPSGKPVPIEKTSPAVVSPLP